MSGRAERTKLVRKLQKKGFEVEKTGGNHWRVRNPKTGAVAILGSSPRSSGTYLTMKRLREIGYKP